MIISQLPELFVQRERALLGPRFDAMFSYPGQGAVRGASVNALRCTPQQFAELADFPLEESPFCASAFVVPQPDWKPGRHPYHHAGAFYAQEPSASAPAALLDVHPGMRVADLCAAPGGKSLTLAECMQDNGRLVSGEFAPSRVPLLQKAFDRCGITCAVAVENNAAVHNNTWPKFDRVLCDVPCSGLGVIAKKPDIRYKDLDGIENLLDTQQKILQNGADSLAENGRLVYSTCTVNVQENQNQVEKFLSANPDFHLVQPESALPGADITPLGTVFLPHKTGTDGFFAAILERN